MYIFLNLYFTFYLPNGSQRDINEREEQVIQPFFMLYSSFQCYIVIQSFHSLHHTVDVHSQQNARNCRLSWKCNFDFDKRASTILRDKAYFILVHSKDPLFALPFFFIMDDFISFSKCFSRNNKSISCKSRRVFMNSIKLLLLLTQSC